MRNYYLLADFWTQTSPKYTNLVRTRRTAHWDLTRNPRSQRAGGLTGGVENGCDELCRGNASHRTRAQKGSLRSDRTRAPLGRYVATELEPKLGRLELGPKLGQLELGRSLGRYLATKLGDRSLHSDRTFVLLGRYVATERLFRSIATHRPSFFETSIRHYSMHSRLPFDAISRRP
ncbi:hypothetical protein F2Q69_00007252 [Brassica cretica]|uniref:Uncharacterized protein n=1 Tax=Brassica cretica TaxID=69181 RepID=A0A8S9PCJ4_BRACR|nr:hypothetical protein F2Q69_00007252 [Brassica cretica]